MTSFSEKTVRGVSLVFLVIFSYLTYKNYYYSPLIVLTIMIFFSTKGVKMFENRIFLSTRAIFWVLFSTLLFLRIYFNESTHLDMKNTKTLMTIAIISLCIGTWIGDFFAKYIYIRIKFCINRLFSKSNKGTYRIVKMENTQQNYMKSLGKKMGIMFYHITLDVNGEERKFLLEKPIKADVAIIFGTTVDELGNVICAKTTKNFNPLMATAADVVIVEAAELVPGGSLDPDHLDISRIFVDYIVKSN